MVEYPKGGSISKPPWAFTHMQQHYELMVLLSPQIVDSDLPAALDKVKQLLGERGAAISKDESLGRRKLAYVIKKARQGSYHLFQFDADTQAVEPLERALRLHADVLRHLLIIRKVRTPEQIEREEAIHAKIEAKRRAAAVAAQPKVELKAEPEQKVSLEELDEKLEKILEDTPET